MTTKRISLEGVEARNDLIKFGVEEALVSSEGTLVLGEKSDSLFKASESLGTSVISHRREAMKAPKMIATVPKGKNILLLNLRPGDYLQKCRRKKDLLNIILCLFHSF